MDKTKIEPGLSAVFQLFIGLRLVIIGLELGIKWFKPVLIYNSRPTFYITSADAIGLVTTITLLIYLLLPWLQKKLGLFYLPLGLVFASISPIIGQNIDFFETPNRLLDLPMVGAWQLVLILFVPLVMIAWEYGLTWVVFYSFTTCFLDLILLIYFQGTLLDAILPFLGVIFVRTLAYLSVGYMVTRLMVTQRMQRMTLARLNTELMRYNAAVEQLAISRERNRLARELHDTLAHTLSGVAVQLEAVKSLWNSDQEKAHGMLELSLQATRAGLNETRHALHALRASPLEEMGLIIALRTLVETTANRYALSADIEINEVSIPLSFEVEQCFYRIAQEALENIARHANAKQLHVSLTNVNSLLRLVLSDDGIGFDPQEAINENHYGIKGMKERAEMAGALMTISSQKGFGTKIELIKEL